MLCQVLIILNFFIHAQVGAERYNLLMGCPQARTATIVLRGGSEQFIDEADRSLHDAIMIVRRALKHAEVVPGGGAIEMEVWTDWCNYINMNTLQNLQCLNKLFMFIHNQVSKALREHALTHTSKAQMYIKAFAKALEVIPRQLCSNAGFDATDVLNKLRQQHALSDGSGKVWHLKTRQIITTFLTRFSCTTFRTLVSTWTLVVLLTPTRPLFGSPP